MDAAVAALIGAALGALPGIVAPLWTQHAESRRARLKLAVELGRDDFQFQREQAMSEGGLLHPAQPWDRRCKRCERIIKGERG